MGAVCMVGDMWARSVATRGAAHPRVLVSIVILATRALRPWCLAQLRLLAPPEVLVSLMLCATTVDAKVT